MARVESFDLDHTKVLAPYVRLAGEKEHSGVTIQKYDLRFMQPNKEALPTAAIHTLEHWLATYLRDELEGIIDLSPMGCRTGFYLILWDQHTTTEIRDALQKTLKQLLELDTIPAITAKECGHYRDHSLFAAKEYIKDVLEQGFSDDPFVRQV